MTYVVTREDHLEHHGILGQKWGVRRYQNKDGSYTEEGRKRRGYSDDSGSKKKSSFGKKLATTGAVAIGAALAVYGAYRLDSKIVSDISAQYQQMADDYLKLALEYQQKASQKDYTFREKAKTVSDKVKTSTRNFVTGKINQLNDHLADNPETVPTELKDAVKKLIANLM